MSDEAGIRRSKIMSRDYVGDLRAWQPPAVGSAPAAAAPKSGSGVVTAKQIEAIQKQAYDEGFALGRREGANQVAGQLRAVLDALSEPLADFDDALRSELVALITAVSRQLIRRELKTNPGEVVGLVREALAALPAAARDIRVQLHPEDAALVREALPVSDGGQYWKIVEDPAQPRGGCRVFNDASCIDASVESRLTAVITQMLGGEREHDRG